jgi:glycosyltransferase involved in cell wall biosynthesis
MSEKKIRVLIDGALLRKPRGLGRYVKELLHALGGSDDGSDFEFCVLVDEQPPAEAPRLGIQYVVCPRLPIPVWEQLLVPFMTWRLGANVVHCPCNTKSLLFNTCSVPHVVTLHDLMFVRVPGKTLYQKIGAAYRRFVVPRMFKGNIHLVSPSEETARDISQVFGRTSIVIPTSVESFTSAVKCTECAEDLKGSPGLRYFLHIGGEYPNKNTRLLIQAFLDANIADVRLIVLGVSENSALATDCKCQSVGFPGWISDRQVGLYISGAIAMLFPSLEEGYGLPIVEAFSLGCPVMTSNRPPMSELAGQAALLVDPESKAEMIDACRLLAANSEERARLAAAGLIRSGLYSADRMRANLIEVYRAAAQPRTSPVEGQL